ncbi:hypothetical protein phiA019_0138 [Aeromonas phage phiA019]|nr:hypothetical protein phiA009_0141 [Aeromonas phage phiA009]ULG01674.1 hypothetical protein phiA019_0138 [Aeromonas phage phiA019]
MDKTSLGDRMKKYEKVAKTNLMQRTPVIIRLDGKAFHTYTKNCDKPFDQDLHNIRKEVLEYLCENIQGCVLGYSQSDEITLVLKDWYTYSSQAWFDNSVQKLCSISASMATAMWNSLVYKYKLQDKFSGLAVFDARCFNIPINEVVNCLIWRQQDWERNSVQMLARSFYSQKQCHGKSCKDLVTKIEEEQGVVWGNLATWQKRGEFWFDEIYEETPKFKDVRQVIEELLYLQNDN